MSNYKVYFQKSGNGYICKMSDNDTYGGGAFESYQICISGPDKFSVDTKEYVKVLSPYNNSFQNKGVRDYYHFWKVIDHGTPLNEKLVYGHAKILLDALRSYETFGAP